MAVRAKKRLLLYVALVSGLAAAAWTAAVASGSLACLDQRVFDAVARHRTGTGVGVMTAISYLGSEYLTPVFLVLAALLMRRTARRWGWFLVAVVASSAVWQIGLKHLLAISRPPPLLPYWQKAGYPSGHALAALCFAWIALIYLRRRFPGWPRGWGLVPAALLAAWPVIVGSSRVYLAAHWTSDIVGGLLLGIMHLSGAWWLYGAELDRGGPPLPRGGPLLHPPDSRVT